MKLGLFSACFPDLSLEQVATIATELGIEALEVAAWPTSSDRPYTPAHLQVAAMTGQQADAVLGMLQQKSLEISCVAYYDNNLHPDPSVRADVHGHLAACVDAAALLGCTVVGTFVGRDPTRTVSENLRLAEQIFPALIDYAGERGVRLAVENCVMEGWHPDGYPGNLAYSPELWEWMFSLGLYLNYDPSHLCWLGIDPVAALRPYVSRVVHAQAKDIEIFADRRNRYGYPGRAIARDDPWDTGWWRYRVPGAGEVDWKRIVDVLYEGGFEGALSIEHEDPVWSGTEHRARTGVEIAVRTLRASLAPVPGPHQAAAL